MAIPSTAVWEVRTTGNDANGGFYDSALGGTDYSQQDSPQLSLTDVVTNGTTTVTSVTGGFTAAMVGSGINIAGTIYEITARASTTSITIDRTAGAASGQTGNVGGAIATPGKLAANEQNFNIAYFKGTFTISTVVAITAAEVVWIGYGSTRTDGTHATFTSSTNSCNLFSVQNGLRYFDHFTFTHTAATRGIGFDWVTGTFANYVWYDCLCDGCSTFVKADNLGAEYPAFYMYFDHCEVKNCTRAGIQVGSAFITNCYLHDNSLDGVFCGDAIDGIYIEKSVLANNGGAGVYFQTANICHLTLNNVVIYNNTGSGIDANAVWLPFVVFQIRNTIFVSNGGYGINTANMAGTRTHANSNNAYYNNTSGARNGFAAGTNDVTLTGDPFTNAAGGDYSLNSTAGAGAACRSVGFPGASLFGTGYEDIGALRHQDAGGGAAGMLFVPNMAGT